MSMQKLHQSQTSKTLFQIINLFNVTGHYKVRIKEQGEGDQGRSRVRKMKKSEKLEGQIGPYGTHLLTGTYLSQAPPPAPHHTTSYTQTGIQGPYFQVLAGTNSTFSQQPGVFSDRHFKGSQDHPRDTAFSNWKLCYNNELRTMLLLE